MTEDSNGEDASLDAQVEEFDDAHKPIWGGDFISRYITLASMASTNNDHLNTAGMYVILGQAMRDVVHPLMMEWVDGRINALCIQPSGTGKDPAFDFMKLVADVSGVKMDSIASVTSAGLIGTVEKGGNVKYGVAKDADIIGFKEASTLFLTARQEHSNDLVNQLNQILDKNGHVKKVMASGIIEFDTKASLFGTTYPPRGGIKYIPEGFIPRLMISFRDVKSNFYFDVSDWIIDNIGIKLPESKNDIFGLAKTVELVKKHVNGEYFTIQTEGRVRLRKLRAEMLLTMKEYDNSVQEFMCPFINRVLLYCIKVASCHAAVDRLSHDVTEKHVNMAAEYIMSIWISTMEFINKYKPYVGDKRIGEVEDVIKMLSEDGKHLITLRDILRRTHLLKSNVMGVLMSLQDMGLVKYETEIKTSGKKTTKILWRGYCEDAEEPISDPIAEVKSDQDATKQ